MIWERQRADGQGYIYTVDETLDARRFAKSHGWLQTSFFGDLSLVLMPSDTSDADRLEFELICS